MWAIIVQSSVAVMLMDIDKLTFLFKYTSLKSYVLEQMHWTIPLRPVHTEDDSYIDND